MKQVFRSLAMMALLVALQACQSSGSTIVPGTELIEEEQVSSYVIGPGDELQVYVWENPELTVTIPVRPDGSITIPLVEDVRAVGKSPSDLARDIEEALSEYVRTPTVNVIVTNFRGTFRKQIRVVGQAVSPQAMSFQSGMTLLDVMIEVGGLTEFAAGNRAKIIRWEDGVQKEIRVKLKDLLNDGDISANVQMLPGDVLIIPESFL